MPYGEGPADPDAPVTTDDLAPADTGDARLRVFAYAVAEKADVYLAIIDVMAAGAERFRLQQRPREIRRDLAAGGLVLSDDEVLAALDQLHGWGNLTRLFDPTAAETLAEFYGRRYLYQLTPAGIAAHEGIQRVRAVGLDAGGRLSRVLLPRVHERLEAVRQAAADGDAGRLYAALLDLFGTYAELADNAGRYMNDLAVETSTVAADDESFAVYKQAVLTYLDEFVAGMATWVPRIAERITELDADAEALLALAATADAAPAVDGRDDAGPLDSLRQRWHGARSWFVGTRDEPAVATALRAAMLEAINRILLAVERLGDRHLRRISREADLMTLARWFADLTHDADAHDATSDDAAHHLWDLAFGLFPARHMVQAAGDELYDDRRSFWDAEPAEIAPRLRTTGTRASPGRPGGRADYSQAKADRLAAVRAAEAAAVAVTRRLATRSPLRLSELRRLDVPELERLLELIDAALTSPAASDGSRHASLPGLDITLSPVASDARARITTPIGTLDCPDHLVVLDLDAQRSARRPAAATRRAP